MSDLRKLLPCPFCGKQGSLEDPDTLYPTAHWREDEEIRHYFGLRDGRQHHGEVWTMHCPQPAGGCGAQISGDSEDEAVDNWNRRIDATLAEPKDSQPVPVEPECVKYLAQYEQADEEGIVVKVSRQAIHETLTHIDTLQSDLRRVTDDRDALHKKWEETFGPVSFGEVLARIEAAESLNNRMVELLRGMRDTVFYLADYNTLMETERKLVDDVSKLLKDEVK